MDNRNLPSPILSDILSRLPFKDVCRCKCVCKAFMNLVSESYFASQRLSRQPLTLLSKRSLSAIEFNPYANRFETLKCLQRKSRLPHVDIDVIGTCNGVLCLSASGIILICNPIMDKEHLKIPKAFGEKHCQATYGFGFNPGTGQYKMIRISTDKCHFYLEGSVKILTVGTDRWRNIETTPSSIPKTSSMSNVFHMNGALYWMLEMSIYALDLAEEQIMCIPLPSDIDSVPTQIKFRVLGKCLSVTDERNPDWLNIWMMNEDGVIKKSWTKVQVTKLSRRQLLDPVVLWNGGEILFMLGDGGNLLVSYDIAAEKFTNYYGVGTRIDEFLCDYVPSFVSCKKIFGN